MIPEDARTAVMVWDILSTIVLIASFFFHL